VYENKSLQFIIMKKPFVFYGWIKMSVDTNKTTCTIRVDGHNYNKTAGQFIIAGK